MRASSEIVKDLSGLKNSLARSSPWASERKRGARDDALVFTYAIILSVIWIDKAWRVSDHLTPCELASGRADGHVNDREHDCDGDEDREPEGAVGELVAVQFPMIAAALDVTD